MSTKVKLAVQKFEGTDASATASVNNAVPIPAKKGAALARFQAVVQRPAGEQPAVEPAPNPSRVGTPSVTARPGASGPVTVKVDAAQLRRLSQMFGAGHSNGSPGTNRDALAVSTLAPRVSIDKEKATEKDTPVKAQLGPKGPPIHVRRMSSKLLVADSAAVTPVTVVAPPVRKEDDRSPSLSPPSPNVSPVVSPVEQVDGNKEGGEVEMEDAPKAPFKLARRNSRLSLSDERAPARALSMQGAHIIQMDEAIEKMLDSPEATKADRGYAYLKYARDQQKIAMSQEESARKGVVGAKAKALEAYAHVELACSLGDQLVRGVKDSGDMPVYEVYSKEIASNGDDLDKQLRAFHGLQIGVNIGRSALAAISEEAASKPVVAPKRRNSLSVFVGNLFGGGNKT